MDAGDYAELLALYLGDGCISKLGRAYSLRISLDAKYPQIISTARLLLERAFPENPTSLVRADGGATTVLLLYSTHLPCLFPQHEPGLKHLSEIKLEDWQMRCVEEGPWRFLRGCIWSDGCHFVNRTGPYEYLSYDFTNRSAGILDLFCTACDLVGVEYRRYARRVRVYRRSSVALMVANVGLKA